MLVYQVQMIGQTISHYRIDRKLGAGGMGEVFAATDTHHGRTVAIKVVSEKLMADPELRRRFLQEAKTASALKHPNVVSIFDVGHAAGQHFIAMELVPGVTLEEKIAAQPLPLREALGYAIQIAGALQGAHALGIVHRDLKPGNVMVSDNGQIKLLDFGLAKRDLPFTGSASSETEALGSTIAPMTEMGTIIGTVFYMSPEQAEGKPVDTRSDIFSFGALLYEMLGGYKAFGAETKMAALTAILHKDPPALGNVPPDLWRLVERCLRKDAGRRAQSMADVRVELEDILGALDKPTPAQVLAPTQAPQPTRRWILPALAGAAVGAVPAVYLATRPTAESARFLRHTYRHGAIHGARFAPGGNIVYTAEWDGAAPQLYMTQPGVREARDLQFPDCRVAAISHKGELALIRGGVQAMSAGLLLRVHPGGGQPKEVLENVVAADWALDGEQLLVSRIAEGKARIDFPIGKPVWQSEGRPASSLRLSPDGKRIAFVQFERVTGDYSVMLWEDGQTRQLHTGYRGISELGWSPNGREVFVGATHLGQEPGLLAIALDGRERILGQTAGNPLLLDTHPDGRLLISHISPRLGIRGGVPSAPAGRELAWYEASNPYGITADGGTILLAELTYGIDRNVAIFLRKTNGADAVRLGYGGRPALSPDGRWVASLYRQGAGTSVQVLPTGAGESRSLMSSGFTVEGVEWIDAERLLVAAARGNEPLRSWLCDTKGTEPKPVTDPGVRAQAPSANGEIIVRRGPAYFRRPLEGGEPQPLPALTPADLIMRWADTGQHLLTRRMSETTLEIHRVDVSSRRREKLHTLVLPEPGSIFGSQAHISPDGKWWIFSYQRELSTLYSITGML